MKKPSKTVKNAWKLCRDARLLRIKELRRVRKDLTKGISKVVKKIDKVDAEVDILSMEDQGTGCIAMQLNMCAPKRCPSFIKDASRGSGCFHQVRINDPKTSGPWICGPFLANLADNPAAQALLRK